MVLLNVSIVVKHWCRHQMTVGLMNPKSIVMVIVISISVNKKKFNTLKSPRYEGFYFLLCILNKKCSAANLKGLITERLMLIILTFIFY